MEWCFGKEVEQSSRMTFGLIYIFVGYLLSVVFYFNKDRM
jgi:hypothetical protein